MKYAIRGSVLKTTTTTFIEIIFRNVSSSRYRVFGFVTVFGLFYITILVTGYSYFHQHHQAKSARSFNRIMKIKNIQESSIVVHSSTTSIPFRKYSLNTSTTKTILLWDLPKSVSYPENLSVSRCGKCTITRDKTAVNKSDAVVFHFNGSRKPSDFPSPKTRHKDQIYVWTCRESPKTTKDNYNLDLSSLANMFNWTMTHRLDSDVFYPYAEILHRLQDNKISNQSELTDEPKYVDLFYQSVEYLLSQKQHLVAWVVGNCGNTVGAQARMKLVNSFSKFGLPIHKFGRCFKDKPFPPYRSEETHAILMKYKFYLAFENTFGCRDYVTYKFWKNAIYSGAVPIAWGPSKQDLLRLAPKRSFLHIEDFESVGHLVNYLKYIDSNDTAYREFFEWREKEIKMDFDKPKPLREIAISNNQKDWIFSRQQAFGYCKLCRKLHAKDSQVLGDIFTRKSISSLQEWWYGTESEACFK
uniref:4-galactosyl-N-acetylglucosaminide 3-alpha-L-fucosyltransferase FUT6-like n=1 Tax=Styela clava TaxID=7725 RepID=UPI00193A8E48|nr:4-galactosyl-N-acetylglucosaminide 3-alpha-L-fucosyltransferase FUT6-like [Styela clava]